MKLGPIYRTCKKPGRRNCLVFTSNPSNVSPMTTRSDVGSETVGLFTSVKWGQQHARCF